MFFLFIFTCNLGAHLFPFINYAINKEYIARKLCVNKDKPKMNCNGKCHLKKQLSATHNNEPGKQESKEKYEDCFFISGYPFDFSTLSTNCILVSKKDHYTFLNDRAVFHPPQMI